MPGRGHHLERHRTGRANWLRAGVLGAQDGIVSTAALLIGVAAANGTRTAVLVAGIATLVAGSMSMATGEYGSVSSQRDTELADLAREERELRGQPDHELEELTLIYEDRGLDRPLAQQVATQLTEKDALEAHARDELGLTAATMARPLQAASVSAASFAMGSLLALVPAALISGTGGIIAIAAVTLGLLAALGVLGARLGGAPALRPALRLLLGGGAAMVLSAGVGALVGTAV